MRKSEKVLGLFFQGCPTFLWASLAGTLTSHHGENPGKLPHGSGMVIKKVIMMTCPESSP
jgi:hypothetical protein